MDASTLTEERLREDLAEFGTIEQAAVVPDRHCAFVSFTSVQAALKAVQQLPSRDAYRAYRIAYGKDNCARSVRGAAGGGGGAGHAGATGAMPSGAMAARMYAAGGNPGVVGTAGAYYGWPAGAAPDLSVAMYGLGLGAPGAGVGPGGGMYAGGAYASGHPMMMPAPSAPAPSSGRRH